MKEQEDAEKHSEEAWAMLAPQERARLEKGGNFFGADFMAGDSKKTPREVANTQMSLSADNMMGTASYPDGEYNVFCHPGEPNARLVAETLRRLGSYRFGVFTYIVIADDELLPLCTRMAGFVPVVRAKPDGRTRGVLCVHDPHKAREINAQTVGSETPEVATRAEALELARAYYGKKKLEVLETAREAKRASIREALLEEDCSSMSPEEFEDLVRCLAEATMFTVH